MGILDRFRSKPVYAERSPVIPVQVGDSIPIPKSSMVGRTSKDDDFFIFTGAPYAMLPPKSSDEDWQAFTLDATTFSQVAPGRIIELLGDMSPEVSKALWDYLRMCNPGWDFDVFKPNGTTRHREGYQVVLETLDNWAYTGVSMDTIFSRLNASAFFRGALFSELIFDTDGKTSIGLATPDPITVRFIKKNKPVLGDYYQMGQIQDGQFKELTRPTIQYIPVDPNPGSPYGRPIASPAIFTGLFLLGLLHDLRRVIAQQGYPRIDISISTEVLLKLAPAEVRQSPEKLKNWIDEMINQVKTVYSGLEPTDAYIHIDAITLKDKVGVVGNDSLGALPGIIQSLERMSIRALKTMPILMAVMEGSSDSNSNRQWEMQSQGIKAIQHLTEHMMQRHLSLVLQAHGIQAVPKWRFAELRSSEGLRDEQTNTLAIGNEVTKYMMGWISNEEASLNIVGHKPFKEEPIVLPGAPTREPAPNANKEEPKASGDAPNPQQQKSQLVMRVINGNTGPINFDSYYDPSEVGARIDATLRRAAQRSVR